MFEARAAESERVGGPSRSWPPVVTAYLHWVGSYKRAAVSAALDFSLNGAVDELNKWIAVVDASH
ncbi:hypothetical protein GCM10010922_25120 [Microbacterium sorbitolivorans]|nr:hypothetical protein GCM10010922_25120 [Microbacterium sorbitolivorans]